MASLALEMGFKQVSLSSDLAPMIRIVPRGHTAVVDAYLTPVIKEYLENFMSGITTLFLLSCLHFFLS